MMSVYDWLTPDWPAPAHVRAACTTRQGGVSVAPFDHLNLGDHVGDDPQAVAQNRQTVAGILGLPAVPFWLQQVHGTVVAREDVDNPCRQADAAVAFKPGAVCVVMTADCLPVLFCDRAGTRIAAAHAGWRGLCDGILEATVRDLACDPADLLAWMGPAIGPKAFEVGGEVRAAFMAQDSQASEAFIPGMADGKWFADLYQLARQRLQTIGLNDIYGGCFCTYSNPERFYSFRRDGKTGRMASLVWLADAA